MPKNDTKSLPINTDLQHQISRSAIRYLSNLNISALLVLQRSSLKSILVPMTSLHKPAPIPSPFDSLIPFNPFTPFFMSPSLNHQLRTPSPTTSNHLCLQSTSMANLNMRSPKSSTPSSTDNINASCSTSSNGLDMKESKKNPHGSLPQNSNTPQKLSPTSTNCTLTNPALFLLFKSFTPSSISPYSLLP